MVLKFVALEKNEIRQRVDAIRVWINSEDSHKFRVGVRNVEMLSATLPPREPTACRIDVDYHGNMEN